MSDEMQTSELHVITGAFGFTGRHIAQRLLEQGKRVLTLTRHPERLEQSGLQMDAVLADFRNPEELAKKFKGATILYNTYWTRFPYGGFTFEDAVKNTQVLLGIARESGIRRVVHISVTNPSLDSPLPYFRGKAEVEKAVIESGLSYAIIRPTLIFGDEGILINNLAWFLRRFPIFAVPGNGDYRVQPVAVEDVVELAMGLGASDDNLIIDAAGPETYTFNELLESLMQAVGSKTRLIHANPELAYFCAKLIGYALRDVVITRDEIKALMSDLLISNQAPTGGARFSDWLAENADWLGRRYMNDLRKHYR